MDEPKEKGIGPHLNHDEIIRSVVDESDLEEVSKRHLSSCAQCLREKQRLEAQLTGIGTMAEALFEPPPLRTGFLGGAREKKVLGGAWVWKGLVAAAVSACLVVALLWTGRGTDSTVPEWTVAQWRKDALKDEQLRTEVVRLEENALPDIYLYISGESDDDVDEDLPEFLIPEVSKENGNFQITKEVYHVA